MLPDDFILGGIQIILSNRYPSGRRTTSKRCGQPPGLAGGIKGSKIEHKHLILPTQIKRLVRKTLCFPKSTPMHDIVIRLFINRFQLGRAVSMNKQHTLVFGADTLQNKFGFPDRLSWASPSCLDTNEHTRRFGGLLSS